MGLEAILLEGNAREISFRNSLLLAKLLGFSGLGPKEVRETAKMAYEVRSSFAHGSRMSKRHEKKIKERYGGAEEFTSTVLDLKQANRG